MKAVTEHGETRHDARVNGVRLHYVARGEGPTVLLLHGFPETHRSWDLQLPFLAGQGFRAVAPDLPGYGQSEAPRSGYDLDTLARDVAELAKHLGPEPVRLVGHDWGGAITWRVAALYPELLERVVVLACPHPELMAQALLSNRRQLRRSWYMFFFQLPLLPELWLARQGGKELGRMFRDSPGAERAPRELVAAEQEQLANPSALRGPLAYYRKIVRSNAAALLLRRRALRADPIELPFTLIWGEHDSCLGQELIAGSERYAAKLDVHVLRGAGHFLHQERPDELNQLLARALASP